MRLTPPEGRVLGCLVEKSLTTPQLYPLTDNALIAACNQTTSREPVVGYDLTTVRLAVRSLRDRGLARTVHRTGERSDKHQHELPTALGLSIEQAAVLAVLLLRGPRTAAELRIQCERMHRFASVGQVERVLCELSEREEPLVARLPRQAGRREDRFAELLVTEGGGQPAAEPPTSTVAAIDHPDLHQARQLDEATQLDEARQLDEATQLASLRDEVALLRAEVAALRAAVKARHRRDSAS